MRIFVFLCIPKKAQKLAFRLRQSIYRQLSRQPKSQLLSFLGYIPFLLFADKVILPKERAESVQPWFTGPLLAPSAAVVPLGHVNFEPYVYSIADTGFYRSDWKVLKAEHVFVGSGLQSILQIGLTSWMNIQIAPTFTYNYSNHQASWQFNDFPVQLAFQLFAPKGFDSYLPYIKLILEEIFPTGKYRNFDPKKQETDFGGDGSFNTQIGLVVSKMFHLTGIYYFLPRLFFVYGLPAPVRLKGFNTYGGGYGTKARFFPAQTFQVDLGIELTLAQNWAFACDFVGTWSTKTHFSGNRGVDAFGLPAPLGFGSAAQFALAPAFEYNWSDSLGLIAGAWFTVAGRNTPQFFSGLIAINYYK